MVEIPGFQEIGNGEWGIWNRPSLRRASIWVEIISFTYHMKYGRAEIPDFKVALPLQDVRNYVVLPSGNSRNLSIK
jgi:hypothetical protein